MARLELKSNPNVDDEWVMLLGRASERERETQRESAQEMENVFYREMGMVKSGNTDVG